MGGGLTPEEKLIRWLVVCTESVHTSSRVLCCGNTVCFVPSGQDSRFVWQKSTEARETAEEYLVKMRPYNERKPLAVIPCIGVRL